MTITLTRGEIDTMLKDVAMEDVDLSYSGRGMFGDRCIAYTGNALASFTYTLATILAGRDNADSAPNDIQGWIAQLSNPASDSLGLGRVWYWRGICVAHEVVRDYDY